MNTDENNTNQTQDCRKETREEASPDCSTQSGPEQAQARPQIKLPVSEARLAANRSNAQKSTGPKTEEGKAHSRKNATKHGLRARLIAEEELSEPFLCEILKRLEEEYGGNGLVADLTIDMTLLEIWRIRKSLALEIQKVHAVGFFETIGIGNNLHRYATSARNGLQKNLETLERLRRSNSTKDGERLEKAEIEDKKGNRDEAGGQQD